MFNQTNQEVNVELYHEEVIETIPNSNEYIKDHEILLLITPSKNYFKAKSYPNDNKSKVFEKLIDARTYLLKIIKKV